MSNKIFYIQIETGKLLNSLGVYILDKPIISYQAQPTWELHFVSIGTDGILIPSDLTEATGWKAAIDTDFDSSTQPMVRTLPEGFDISKRNEGIITVNLDANTETFLAKIDKKQNVDAYLEVRGYNGEGRLSYDYKIKITCIGAIDPVGTLPLPVPQNTVTQEWVMAKLSIAAEIQFSVDGNSWHETQNLDDIYFRSRYPDGDWSEAILISNIRTDDLNDYYTKTEVDDLIAENTGSETDLSNYYTKTETDRLLNEKAEAITYTDVSTITFADNQYFNCTNILTELNINISTGLKNTMCKFTTGDSITFNISISSEYKVNKVFAFEANTSYIIGIDFNTILWAKLETIEG